MAFPILFLCLLLALPVRAQHLRLVTEEIPPSVMKKGGQITGYSADKVRALMARTGITYTLDLYPWSRTFAAAQTQPGTCAFPMTRLPEREALFKWIGPLHVSDWQLYGRAKDHLVIKDLEDARGLRIGSFVNDTRIQALKERGLHIEYVANDELNVKKLLLGRIDLWVASKRHAEIEMERKGLSGQLVPVFTFRRAAVYLACHPSVPDTEVARLNAAMAALVEDGSVAAIEGRYTQARD